LSFSGGAGISLLEQGIIEGENPVCDLRSSGLVSTSWPDAFKVAVNRLCNVADDVYRKQYIDKSLDETQYNSILAAIEEMEVEEADKIYSALQSGKINKDNYKKVMSKLTNGSK